MKLVKYRIVTDTYAGYEVQKWRLWLPIWIQVGANTHMSIERAKDFINRDIRKVVYSE